MTVKSTTNTEVRLEKETPTGVITAVVKNDALARFSSNHKVGEGEGVWYFNIVNDISATLDTEASLKCLAKIRKFAAGILEVCDEAEKVLNGQE